MLRTVLVVIHAGAGLGGLVVGLLAMAPPARADRRTWARALYAACIVVLLGAMVALVALDWRGLETGARVAFTALTGLGAAMGYRLVRARHESRAQAPGWQERYIGHVYFTYVSLWIGFLVVPALRLPYPQFAVPGMALAVLALGHALVTRYTQRFSMPADTAPAQP